MLINDLLARAFDRNTGRFRLGADGRPSGVAVDLLVIKSVGFNTDKAAEQRPVLGDCGIKMKRSANSSHLPAKILKGIFQWRARNLNGPLERPVQIQNQKNTARD